MDSLCNWFNTLPLEIGKCTKLKTLIASRNFLHPNAASLLFSSLQHLSSDAADGKSQQISLEDDNNDTNAASTTTASIPPSQQEGKQLQSRTQDKIITITTTAETSAAMLEAQALREKARQLLEEYWMIL